MHHILLRSAFIVVSAFATFASSPANAARWVLSGDPYIWINLDTIQLKDGVTYFVKGHSSVTGMPPQYSDNAALNAAINCSTNEHYYQSMANAVAYNNARDNLPSGPPNPVTPVYEWKKFLENSYAAAYFVSNKRIVCNR